MEVSGRTSVVLPIGPPTADTLTRPIICLSPTTFSGPDSVSSIHGGTFLILASRQTRLRSETTTGLDGDCRREKGNGPYARDPPIGQPGAIFCRTGGGPATEVGRRRMSVLHL